MTKIWAHRGASGYAPENTLEAFALAAEQKVDGVELDVQLTKDDKLVVIHDETVKRVSGVDGYVRDFTLAELKKLNVNKTIQGYKEVHVPTLTEVYDLLKYTGLMINVEIKSSVIWYSQIEEKVLALTKEMNMQNQVIFSSFNHYSIKKIKELDSTAQTGMLYSDVLCNIAEYAQNVGVDALHPVFIHRYMDSVFQEYMDSKIPLHIWTVNQEEDMRFFMENKIDAIITNYPDIAVKVRDSLE